MSDYNRGSASGSEQPLAFEDRRQPQRGGGPAPITLILSLVLLLAVGGGVYFMYRGGARAPGGPPQPVGAPVRDVKVAAPPQAPTPDPASGLSVYKENQGDSLAAPAFVPPPEQPTPRPVAATPAPPAVVAITTPTAAPASSAASAAKATTATAVKPTIVAQAAARKPVAKPSPKPVTIDKILADNSDVKSPTKPLVKPAVKSASASASAPETASPAGGTAVQIGAFSTKALADAGWNTAASAAPGSMAGKGKHVVPVTKADGSILYRTSITGFTSHADAEALCARLKAAGGSCFVR